MIDLQPNDAIVQHLHDIVRYTLAPSLEGTPSVRRHHPGGSGDELAVTREGQTLTVRGGLAGAVYVLRFGEYEVQLRPALIAPVAAGNPKFATLTPGAMPRGSVVRTRYGPPEWLEITR